MTGISRTRVHTAGEPAFSARPAGRVLQIAPCLKAWTPSVPIQGRECLLVASRGSRSLQCQAATKPWSKKEGRLVLADGTVLFGRCFGAEGVKVAEIVFNTSMSGYQEIMTDPSYRDQMVCFTHPHIGNVGINDGTMFYVLFHVQSVLDFAPRVRGYGRAQAALESG